MIKAKSYGWANTGKDLQLGGQCPLSGHEKVFLPGSKIEFSKFPVEQSQNFLPLKAPSTQLGIFKGRGPIHEKGTLSLLIEDTVCEYCFSDPLVEEHRRRFTDTIALKNNNSYC